MVFKYLLPLFAAITNLYSAQITLTNLSALPLLSTPQTNHYLYVLNVTTNNLGQLVYTPYKMPLTFTNLELLTGTTNFGGGGTPGGSSLQLQFNNSGVFGGAAGITTDASQTNLLTKGAVTANSITSTNALNGASVNATTGNLTNINATTAIVTNTINTTTLTATNTVNTTTANGTTGNFTNLNATSVVATNTVAANTVVGTNGVSGASFTGTGNVTNSEVNLPNDAGTSYFSIQAFDTAASSSRIIGPNAAFGGIPYYNLVSSTNMNLTNLTLGTWLSISGTTLNVVPTTGAGVTNISGTLSANVAAGSNITLTTNANGQISIASSAGGGSSFGPNNFTTSIGPSNTVTETTIFTNTITGGVMGTTKPYKVTIDLDVFNNSGIAQTFTLKVYHGGTVIYQHISSNEAASANHQPATLTFILRNKASASIQTLIGKFEQGSGSGTPTTGIGVLNNGPNPQFLAVIGGSGAKDTSTAQGFGVTITLGVANASYAILATGADDVVP